MRQASPLESTSDSALSPQQEHILRLVSDEGGNTFSVEARIRIEGELDVETMRLAVQDVAEANDILRTTFDREGESPLPHPHVHPANGCSLEVHDLTPLPAAEQDERIGWLSARNRRCSVACTTNTTWCPCLVSSSQTEHALLFALPALCADAVTVEHLMAQIAEAYGARKGGDRTLAPTTFARTLESLRTASPATSAERDAAWWRERLHAAPRVVRLPFDTPLPDTETFTPEDLQANVDDRTRARLQEYARVAGVSQRAILLAAWRVFLWRMTRQADVVLGLACEGRSFGNAYEAPGPIDGFVPLDLQLQPETTFAQVVEQAERRIEECRRAQRSFSWDLLEQADGQGLAPPYFPLTFEYHAPTRVARVGDTVFSIEDRHSCTDRFDLGLLCEWHGDTLETTLRFDAGRMRRSDVESLLESLQVLLASAVEDPEQGIEAVEILSESQRGRILREFNQTDCRTAQASCIHEMIAEQAAWRPAAPAVLFQDESLSYAELDARANQLARYLRRVGVGPNVFVAIHAEPSLEMMVAILGTLKAGGAYVPLDPGNPRERLQFILEDTRAPILLTQSRLDSLKILDGVRVLRLDTEWDEVAAESNTTLPPLCGLDDLAYSIYTSGSTGNPKGVLVTHANLLHSTDARLRYYGGKVGRYLLLSSFAFDSSVAGIFWTLADGGALVLPEAGSQRDPRRIGELMQRHRVTHSLCLASHYALVLAHAAPESFESLETAIVSGEVFSTAMVDRHDERAPGARLFNEYGPTEGSVWSTVFDCHAPFPGHQVPIGEPIANTQIYILDAKMRPVPIGVPGEMYQGGRGVTRGYLNRPDLTEKAFVPDPFSQEPGSRLYRTGDLARYLSDGNIEFLGRIDHQVKIRGYRIELGEIEAVLGKTDDLREVAVICREDEPGERYLAAYYVCRPGRTTSVHDLRERLAEKLPAYMIPAAFQELDSLPRTHIGKLDTQALPVPRSDRDGLSAEYVAPRTPEEQVIATIWQSVLEIEDLGVEDDYFELGGHSLLATRIIYRIRETLAIDLPLRTVFDEPTVAGMARTIAGDPELSETAHQAATRFMAMLAMSDENLEGLLSDENQTDPIDEKKNA